VCGTFNAKNSYGGYVGQTLYLYVIATGEVQILDRSGTPSENSAATARFERYCPS
jgi:hypothetical protein